MADTTALKNRIRAAIKANDNQEITGPVLQQALLDMVDELNGATETEAGARQNGDSALQQNINTVSQAVNTETQRAQEAEQTIDGKASKALHSINNLEIKDVTGSQSQVTEMSIALRTNEGSEQDPEIVTLDTLIIQQASEQKAGLLPAKNTWDSEPVLNSKKLLSSGVVYNKIKQPLVAIGEFAEIPLQENPSSGYYYNSSGELISHPGSFYYRLDNLSAYVNKKIAISISGNMVIYNGRYILLMNSSNAVKARVSIGDLVRNDNHAILNSKVAEGDYLLVSWSDDMNQPQLYKAVDTFSSLREDISTNLVNINSLINQYCAYKNTAAAEIGTAFGVTTGCNFKAGDAVDIIVSDPNCCIDYQRVNLYGITPQSSIIDVNKVIKLTLTNDITFIRIDIDGNGIVKDGDITLAIAKDGVLPDFIAGCLVDCYKEIERLRLGTAVELDYSTSSTSGYYISSNNRVVELVANISSAYKAISLDSYVGYNPIIIEVFNGLNIHNARGVALTDSSDNIKEFITLGGIASNGNSYRFETEIVSGDKLYVSFDPHINDIKSVTVRGKDGLPQIQDRLDALEDTTSDIASDVVLLNNDMYGGEKTVPISLAGSNTGYYYSPGSDEVVLNANADSRYIEITLNNIDGDSTLVKVVASNSELPNNARYIILERDGVMLEGVACGYVSQQTNRTYIFNNPVTNGDKLYISWSIISGQPTVSLLIQCESVREEAKDSYHKLFGSSVDVKYNLPTNTQQTGYYYGSAGELVANASSIYLPEINLPESSYDKYLTIEVSANTGVNNARWYLMIDSNGNIVERVHNGYIVKQPNHKYRFQSPIRQGYKLKCSWDKSQSTPKVWFSDVQPSWIDQVDHALGGINKTVYISPTGSDTLDGTKEAPMKTINAALDAGANEIIINEGEYSQNIDFTKCKTSKLLIKGATKKRIIFRRPGTCISDDGSETLVSGYSNVYKIENAPNPSYNLDGALWLFFDGLDDVTTQITAEEVHPCQRGMFYRCECTKSEGIRAFMKGTMSLSDALDEIESATTYKWIYDTNTSTLYFNRAADTATYPLYRASGRFFTPKVDLSLEMSNIEFRYAECNLYYLNMAKIVNCASNYSYAGTWVYDYSIGIEFVNCESCRAFSLNGDGFNGHAADLSTFTRAKRCQVRIIDCWSHDNYDDGYSDHEYAETVIEGGLYEYNGKAGITPSYGSHCTCRNVYSRNNYAGFFYVGPVNDAGNNGQLICYDCVSENNNRGGSRLGFGVANSNQAIFVNCMAINETTGYYVGDTCRAKFINCKSLECTTPLNKSADATVIIQNGTLITEE